MAKRRLKKDIIISFLFLFLCITIYFFVEPNDESTLRVCADLYLHGGTIWTATGEQVEAVAVLASKIYDMGTIEDISKYYCAEKTTAISLHGKMLTPGWIDSHVHSIVVIIFTFFKHLIL